MYTIALQLKWEWVKQQRSRKLATVKLSFVETLCSVAKCSLDLHYAIIVDTVHLIGGDELQSVHGYGQGLSEGCSRGTPTHHAHPSPRRVEETKERLQSILM